MTVPRPLLEQARDAVLDDLYAEAEEQCLIRWLPATQIDPGCWSADLDVEIDWTHPGEPEMEAKAVALYGTHQVVERRYTFNVDGDGYLSIADKDDA